MAAKVAALCPRAGRSLSPQRSLRNSSFIDVTYCIQRPYGFPDDDLPPIMSPGKKQISLALRGPIGTVGPTELQLQDR